MHDEVYCMVEADLITVDDLPRSIFTIAASSSFSRRFVRFQVVV